MTFLPFYLLSINTQYRFLCSCIYLAERSGISPLALLCNDCHRTSLNITYLQSFSCSLLLGVFTAIDRMSISKGKKGGRIINIASMAGLLEGMR